jgi:hypothetical protein
MVLDGFMYSEGRPITASFEAQVMPLPRLPEFHQHRSQAAFATKRASQGLTAGELRTAVQIPNLRRAGLISTQAPPIGLSLSARLGIEWYFSPIPPSLVV